MKKMRGRADIRHRVMPVARSGQQSCITLGTRARKRLALAVPLAFLTLTGCVQTRYVTVYCLDKNQALPSEPPKISDKLTGKADEDLRIVTGSAIRLRAWGVGLQGILEGCRSPN